MARRKGRGGKDAVPSSPKFKGQDISNSAPRIFAGLRVEKRYTQRGVADRLGKRPSWTNLLENGHYTIKLQDVFDLCALYNQDPLDVVKRIMSWQPTEQKPD